MRLPGPSKAQKIRFLVPFSRDNSFIDRVEIFNKIDNYIKQDRRLALSGIGGIGSVVSTIHYRMMQSTTEIFPGSHKLQSNTATDFGTPILVHRLSGFMPVQGKDLIKHTEI